jgi:hypothetical protein
MIQLAMFIIAFSLVAVTAESIRAYYIKRKINKNK